MIEIKFIMLIFKVKLFEKINIIDKIFSKID